MKKKNWLSGRDRELQELAEEYEASRTEGRSWYMDAEDIADIVDWYAVNRKHEQAIELVDYGLRLHPDHTALLVEKAYLYLDVQQYRKAGKLLDKVTEETSEVKVLRANLLMADNRMAEAEALIDEIEDKEDLANIIDVVYMYIDNGFPERALPWIDRNMKRYDDEEAFLAVVADCYYAVGRLVEAEDFYNRLIDRNPYAAPYWFGLARCYFDTMQFDKAIEACDYATVSDEEFVEAIIIRGHAYYQLGNYETALENYLKAKELNGLSASFVDTFIGLEKFDRSEWEEALSYLMRAIEEKDPMDDSLSMPILYANVALCLFHTGEKKKAREYCKISRNMDPYLPDAYLIEGYICMEMCEQEKGAQLWAKAIKNSPTTYVWNEIANYSIELNMLPTALMAYESIKQLEPDYPQINEKLTSLYLSLNDKENFLKYNRLCETPLTVEDLTQLANRLQGESEEMRQTVDGIIEALKNNQTN